MSEKQKCSCSSKSGLLFALKNPEEELDIQLFKLLKKHPENKHKYYYKCESCGQIWEKQTQPHPYGYSENWKKLEKLPNF